MEKDDVIEIDNYDELIQLDKKYENYEAKNHE